MAIDNSGEWWVGSEPEDIRGFLEGYAPEGYEVHRFCLARCDCGSVEFHLEADDDEGVAKRRCGRCDTEHFICDSAEYWDEAQPEQCRCAECACDVMNVGVGFSQYPDSTTSIRWLYVGVRCANCGVLGCFAGWKVALDDVAYMFDQV